MKLSAVPSARLEGATAIFPVSGGKFDRRMGTIEHEGALRFKAGNRGIPLKALQLRTTQHHSPFSVKAGGGQLKLATTKHLTVSVKASGAGSRLVPLFLSAKVAERLGKKLRPKDVFREGQSLGRALTNAQPETVAVLGKGKVSLTSTRRS